MVSPHDIIRIVIQSAWMMCFNNLSFLTTKVGDSGVTLYEFHKRFYIIDHTPIIPSSKHALLMPN